MKITIELIEKHGACQRGLDAFSALYPDGVEWVFDNAAFAAHILASPLAKYLDWASDHIPDFKPFRITAGNYGTASAGYRGTATAGDFGTATAGYRGTATAGYRGTASAGYYGTATAGYGGAATAGYGGTATAGDEGTATAGYGGTATAGEDGVLLIRYRDGELCWRTAVAYVGEDGIQAGVAYRLDYDHRFVRKTP